jgi:hypothetical protein
MGSDKAGKAKRAKMRKHARGEAGKLRAAIAREAGNLAKPKKAAPKAAPKAKPKAAAAKAK